MTVPVPSDRSCCFARNVILVKSQRAGDRVMASIQRFLETKLKLKVNKEKSQVVKASQLEFLGFA